MSKDLFDEELDLVLLDESDDDNVEVEEVADNSSKLRQLLHQEKMKQPGGSGDPKPPRQRLRVLPPDRSPERTGGERKPVTAEELLARSRGADSDRWLGFQVQQELPARQQLGQLQVWLRNNKPSLVERSSGVGWIAVKLGDLERRVKSAQAKAEWDGLRGERTMETVNQLAAKYGDTGGKWLFHVSPQYVDKSWEKIALAMLSGGLGPSVSMVKVSPRGGEEDDSHVIIVYNKDYQNTNQVMRIENLLRSSGVLGDLLYKPDIFSTLGIYRNNIWGFRPTIYSSTMMNSPGKSRVTLAGTGKSYINSSQGLEVKKDVNFNKIVAHISRPEPDFVADYNKNEFKEEEERQKVPGKKKKTVQFDQKENNKKEVEESEVKKSKEKKSPVTDQILMNLEMLNLKSMDDL